MRRRDFLWAGVAVSAAAGAAGCSGFVTTKRVGSPPVLDDRPEAVYFPTHVEGMEMVGVGESGDYKFALMYSYPHRFWNVNGRSVEKTPIRDGDDVHLMATVWDAKNKQVLPESGLSVEIAKDGDVVSQEVIYPMLSQAMGFHYGANFGLDGDGTYDVTVSVGGVNIRRTGDLQGRFSEPASTTISFDYSQAARDEISYEDTPDRAGERAAQQPMEASMPTGVAPDAESLPGTAVGETMSGDARFVVRHLDAPPVGVDGDGYLAVSARTPYNRMTIPAMALEATISRKGETVFEGELPRTLDPGLGYHYGAAVDEFDSGDEVKLGVRTPPQVARHEGYEKAFLEFDRTTLTK